MLPKDVTDQIEAHLGRSVRYVASVEGGCIANASRISSDDGDYFLKWSRGEAARAFPAEAAGLAAMREAGSSLIIPDPLLADPGDGERPGMLLMPWIESGPRGSGFWERFAAGFAKLHRHSADRFGFHVNNFIGRLPQDNSWDEDWPRFFRTCRIDPQVERARSTQRWKSSWNDALDGLYRRLPELLPERPEPSILHGDLWGGNFMIDKRGRPVLIDPASYYGHREADLAMTELFGGFERPFYDAYGAAWPLDPGYEERREIYNLYHLINHLNHFGGSYARSVGSILKRF